MGEADQALAGTAQLVFTVTRVGDDETRVTPDAWLGSRDRSWGVRPVGEPEPPGIRGRDAALPGFFWLYAPMQLDDRSLYFSVQERPDGRRILQEAAEVRSFAAVTEIEDVFDAVFAWMNQPGAAELASQRRQVIASDSDRRSMP